MKAIILGGSGVIGGYVTEALIKRGTFDEICIGDINEERAKNAAQSYGKKATYKKVDLYNDEQLREAIRGFNILINCIGPFYMNADRAIKAALDERVNFVDICDDYDAAELNLTYDEKFKKAGLTAVICAGVSPGMTNIMAAAGVNKLDQAEEVDTSWVENSLDAVGAASVYYHAAHFVDGNIPQVIDGDIQLVPALSGEEEFYFPGIGKYPVYYVGHPEPVTIFNTFKELKRVTNRGNGYPLAQDYTTLLGLFAKMGFTRKDITLNIKGVELTPRDFFCHYLPVLALNLPEEFQMSEGDVEGAPHFLLRVDVKGLKDGEPWSNTYFGTCMHTKIGTGGTAAYVADMIGKGIIKSKGVSGPEGYFNELDIDQYFKYMTDCGMSLSMITKDAKGKETEHKIGVKS